MRTAATLLLLAVAHLVAADRMAGQVVRIGLEMSENTGGALEAAFRNGLRSLDAVALVEPGDSPELVLTVVTVCVPDDHRCGSATAYSTALVLAEPLAPGRTVAAPGTGSGGIERRIGTWALTWTPDRTEEAVGAILAELDSVWFEPRRGKAVAGGGER